MLGRPAGQFFLSFSLLATLLSAAPPGEWKKKIDIDPNDVAGSLAANGLKAAGYVNYYTGRWPYIGFIGGMAMGNRSEDLEFFYSEPFKWRTTVLDYVLENGGKVYGLRARIHGHNAGANANAMRSFLLRIRTDTLLAEYHPSYIYANGRRIWDFKKDKMNAGGIEVPFSVTEPGEITIDLVVDKEYTPGTKGLAFRMFFVFLLGDPGVKVDLADAAQKATGSPADALKKFAFGLYPSGYDFWTDTGVPLAEIRKNWRPNFRPDYPTDDVFTSPFVMGGMAKGKYHEFMTTYGGANVAGEGATAEMFQRNPFLRGALSPFKDPADARRILAIDPKLEAFWFRGEQSSGVGEAAVVKAAKQATGSADRVMAMIEPFPPTLGRYQEYQRGTDLLILKNEEDPQYNILMSMGRGMGRTFGKPFGFYWEQTHYPFPSLDEKLQTCLLYYLSGGSWISAEAEDAPSFANDVVADWVYPFVQALRFATLHPARGKNIVPVGIVYGAGDAWWIPYNPFGLMDTFQRYVEYDNSTNKLTTEPSFTKVFPWMPPGDPKHLSWKQAGHLSAFIDKLDVIQGYNLLDVFFPQYGDAYTAHIARLLTGTPYGPVDFVALDEATPEHLRTFGVLAFLGKASLSHDAESKITDAVRNGAQVIVGVQHFPSSGGFGLVFDKGAKVDGAVRGTKEIFGDSTGKYSGMLFAATGEGWETVASVGDHALVIRKAFGKGTIYVYLGQWVWQGGDALRPVLKYAGGQAAPLKFHRPDDQLEYVAYRKNQGAWVALFNHGDMVIGCDRLKEPFRVQPPEPLHSEIKGPYRGEIEFRLDKLGLSAQSPFVLYQVDGIDGKAFEDVISGHKTFVLREVPSRQRNGVGTASVSASVSFDKRAEFVLAPKGQGEAVFFGKPAATSPQATLRGRVTNAETGQVIPCTVTLQSSDGSILTESRGFNGGFRSSGVFAKAMPPGQTIVTIRRGFDYGAVTRKVELQPGERKDLEFKLRRRTPLHKLGWYASDNHVHMIHGEAVTAVGFPDVALAARAEALDFMSLAQSWAVDREDPAVLERACRKVSTPDLLLTWNMEAPKNYWLGDASHCMGHGWTVGMRGYTSTGKNAISELNAMSAHDYEREKTRFPNFDSHALIHALGGMVSYTHPCRWWRGQWGGRGGYPLEKDKFVSNLAAELPFDTVAGPTYDTVDILMQTHEVKVNEQGQRLWYMLLDHGYRMPGTASSDATFDNPGGALPGAVRNYTRVSGKLTPESLARAMREGRNFVTSGPLLKVDFGGRQIGDVIRVTAPQTVRVSLRAWASGEPGEELTEVEVVRNGKAIRKFAPKTAEFATEFDIRESGTAWYIVRAMGASRNQVAISDPIYFEGPDYQAPKPAQARVTLSVRDASSSQPLDGECEVLRMIGRDAVVQSRAAFHHGALTIDVPATARLRVSAPGHAPAVKSVFIDDERLLDSVLNLRPEQLTDWSTFEKVRALLQGVPLNVNLKPLSHLP